jgi:sugar O-acyltransferase (sialic acid O-acetyltransferase NeuD family)
VLIEIVRRDRVGELAGYVDRRDRGPVSDLSWLGSDADALARPESASFLLAVGLTDNAAARWRLVQRYRETGARLLTVVSSRAVVAAGVELGEGTVVMDLAAVNPGAALGPACIINTGAIVEHDAALGSNVHVAPGAVLCGDVTVGDHCLVGAGCVVVPGVTVVGQTTIGAGAVVTADITESGTYVGVPAVRRNEGMAP